MTKANHLQLSIPGQVTYTFRMCTDLRSLVKYLDHGGSTWHFWFCMIFHVRRVTSKLLRFDCLQQFAAMAARPIA